MAWSGAASGSKANPGGSSGSASGQSSGSAGGGPSGGYQRAGNVNQQGSNQARQGALGTTKAQTNAAMLGQRINSPATTPFSRAAAMAGGYRDRAHMKRAAVIIRGPELMPKAPANQNPSIRNIKPRGWTPGSRFDMDIIGRNMGSRSDPPRPSNDNKR